MTNTKLQTQTTYNMNDIFEALGQTALISKQNTESTAVILEKLTKQENLLSGLAVTTNKLSTDIEVVKDDIDQLKLNEEVTTTQQETIIETAQKRVCGILGDDPLDKQRYFRIFIKRLYTDTRHSAGLGSKISRTKKGDFQRVIDFIEGWVPSCGCTALKERADKNACARLEAKRQGYIN